MKFGELKGVLSLTPKLHLFNSDDVIIASGSCYSPIEDTFDECEVYKVDIVDGGFAVHVDLPTWVVTGTITVDVAIRVKAVSEEAALDEIDCITLDAYNSSLEVRYHGDAIEYISLDSCPDAEWDGAELD